MRWLLLVLAGLTLVAGAARAGVTGIEVTERASFADGHAFGAAGPYERLRGLVHVALDPQDPANRGIVDLDRAPRDAEGRVTFVTDFILLRPVDPARGNGTLIYDVNNRGGMTILGAMNGRNPADNDPRTMADAGSGFLMERGYTLLWSAWAFDVEGGRAGGGPLVLRPPVATGRDGPITGPVAYEFMVERQADRARFTGTRAIAYPFAVANDPAARLTWRDTRDGARHLVGRARWALIPRASGETPMEVMSAEGFAPGRIYELTYVARDPVVVGAGLAGIRDLLSEAGGRGLAGAPPAARRLIFGISQSGRVIETMITQGLHVDEAGRGVFEGAFIHVAGGGKGGFNHRFAMPTRHFTELDERIYPTDWFPFASSPSRDPKTGRVASTLDAARAKGVIPKIFLVNTSWEYWSRSASLIATTPDGTRDLDPDPLVRIYHLAGGQHYPGRSASRAGLSQCVNRLDTYGPMRALLVALDAWTRDGTEPPASAYPKLGEGTLVDLDTYRKALPPIPGLTPPVDLLRPPRLDLGPRFAAQGIIDIVPPRQGAPFGMRVPAPDGDGLDRGGVRLPEMAVPLGTHLGWNTRPADVGFPGHLARYEGSFIPFARTEAERARHRDPRPSLASRYADRADFVRRTETAVDAAIAQGFLLAAERAAVIARRALAYDQVMAHDPADGRCDYLFATP